MRAPTVLALLPLAVSASSCFDRKEAGKEYARAQAAEVARAASGTVEKVTTPVRGGTPIACTDLIDLPTFAAALGNDVLLTDFTAHSRQRTANAVCKIIRAGNRPSAAQQQQILRRAGKLGVLPGDPFCEIRFYCAVPEQQDFERTCRVTKHRDGHRKLGFFVCVQASQRGDEDAYRYQLVEPDTQCVLDVLGGDSVTGTGIVDACARAVVDSVTAESLAASRR